MKYTQIDDYLINRIKSKELIVGEQIEPDKVLAKKFDVSELTVNKAFTNLANRGYLKRIKGRGTFVESYMGNDNSSSMKHSSLSENIRRRGLTPGSKLLEYKICNAEEFPKVQQELNLQKNDLLHYFVRLRTANDIPICLSYSYMPTKLVPYIDINILNNGSLWDFLGSQGFEGTRRCYFTEKIVYANQFQAEQLQVEINHPLFFDHHYSVIKTGEAFNYIDNYYVSERYEIKHVEHTLL